MKIGSKSPLGSLFLALRRQRMREQKRQYHYRHRDRINEDRRLKAGGRYFEGKSRSKPASQRRPKPVYDDEDQPIYKLADKIFEIGTLKRSHI